MALTRQGTPKRRHVSSSAVPGEAFHQELPTHQVPDRGVGLDDTGFQAFIAHRRTELPAFFLGALRP